MTDAELFTRLPELSDEDIKACSMYFTAYLFYQNTGEGKSCYCTSCRSQYFWGLERTMTPEDYEYRTMAHNQSLKCKLCGNSVIAKNMNISKNCSTLFEENRLIIIQPLNHDEVLLRAYFVTKNYDGRQYSAHLKFSETERFYLTPGRAKRWKAHYDYATGKCDRWIGVEKIGEPFNHLHSMGSTGRALHDIVNINKLKGTFLEYSQVRKWVHEFDYKHYLQYPVKYLALYAQYPCIEMMMKLGKLSEFVEDAVRAGLLYKRYINWNGKSPQEIFKLTKQEFNELLTIKRNVVPTYIAYRDFKKRKAKITLTEVSMLRTEYNYRFDKFLEHAGTNPLSLHNYINKQKKYPTNSEAFGEWCDYLDLAEKLQYDLNNPIVKYPKKLKSKHDEAVRSYNAIKAEERKKELEKKEKENLKKLAAHAEERKKYEWSNGEYCIFVPPSLKDIVAEGQALQHCVAGYVDRHADGTLTILFMRKATQPDKPLYTIEMSKQDEIMQAHGFKNQSKPPKEILDSFIAAVKEFKQNNKQDKQLAQKG